MIRCAVVIPTLNAGKQFEKLLSSIENQVYPICEKIIIDSASTDETVEVSTRYGFTIIAIEREKFNHGATRQMAVDILVDVDVILFLTQDAILANDLSIKKMILCFQDSEIGAVYGRQLPHLDAGPFGAHARLFNYPERTIIKSLKDKETLGIKTVFISNSFAAYRKSLLTDMGGFPINVILGEDTYITAKMILAGWKVCYCAEATVFHSHDYNSTREFQRYFDTGIFHAQQPWIRGEFGQANGEGLRFLKSEVKYLWKYGFKSKLVLVLFRTVMKYAGYKMGLMSYSFGVLLKKRI